ncbi:hypothetical protein FRX31_004980 [Thalictrum thalictroides]|uniref:DUF4283 domain-containing protein n=1 Tax=Thalictrum thalictroides TaxID=46969 RepID=A0A7J6X7R9_THATH|nr:hypothetical protein FRX31_004980 [Thalictrum thalictroides]
MEFGRVRNSQQKCSEVVDGKSFEIEWKTYEAEGGNVHLTERVEGRIFRCQTSTEGGRWIGKLLCQISLGSTMVGTVFRFVDNYLSMIGTVRVNRRGLFLQVEFILKQKTSSKWFLCFPAGVQRKGWTNLGGKLVDLLSGRRSGPSFNFPGRQEFPALHFNGGKNISFADMCKGNYERRAQISTQAPSFSHSWWKAVVVCTPSMINPEWRWVREKCDKVFESCCLQVTGGGNALLFLNNEEEVSKLLNMPHLSSWNGFYRFSKWTPEMGSLSVKPGERCDVTIALGGIPYHLRVKSVIEMLAKKCGRNVENVEGESDFLSHHCFVKLRNCDVSEIPHSITLVEKGQNFLIWVEVVEEKLESLAKRLPTRAKAAGESGKGERPVVTLWEEDARDPWKEGGERTQASTCPPGFEIHKPTVFVQVPDHEVRSIDLGPRVEQIHEDRRSWANPNVNVSNRFMGLEVEHDSPSVEVNQRPKETEGGNTNHGTFSEKDPEVIKPFFKPVSAPKQRGRSRSRGKEHCRNIPISLNKHVWRNFNERRWSKANSRDSSLVRTHKLFLQGGDVNPIEVEGNQTQVVAQVRETFNYSEPTIQEDGASSKVEGTQEKKVVDRERLGTIADSLYNCKTTDDYSNWIRWIVIPAAGELGVTYSKSIESQVKLYEDLAEIPKLRAEEKKEDLQESLENGGEILVNNVD